MTNTISELIVNRRTIHTFEEDRIPERSFILSALDVARWAPNHHLTEPWNVYFPGNQTKEAICQLNAELVRERKGDEAAQAKLQRWRNNPGWLLMTCQKSSDPLRQQEDYASCCCFIQNLSLLLWDEQIGMKWSSGDVIREPRCYEISDIDMNKEMIVGILWYGYAKSIPAMKRKPIDDFVFERP